MATYEFSRKVVALEIYKVTANSEEEAREQLDEDCSEAYSHTVQPMDVAQCYEPFELEGVSA